MYAFVQLEGSSGECEQDIVPVANISGGNFDVNSFSKTTKYKIAWNGKLYKGLVLCVGETENEVETIVETLRLRRMPMHLCNTASDDSDEKCELQKGSKKGKEINDGEGHSNGKDTNKKSKIQSEQTCSKSIAPKKKAHVLAKSEANRNSSFIKESNKHLELKKLRQSIENKDSEIKQLTTLNNELQKSVIDATEARMNSMKELIDTVVNEVAELKILIMNGKRIDLEGRQNQDCYPVGYVRHTDDEMHLGNDIWLPVHLYDTAVISCKTASKFVKYMAIVIFGIRTLKNSSISGKVSNRNIKSKPNEVPRPLLDSKKIGAIKKILRFWMLSINKTEEECNLQENRVSKYIASKICELRKDQTEKKQHQKRSHKGKEPLNSSLRKQGISAHNEQPETLEAAHERQEEADGFQYDDKELQKADSDISQHSDTSEEEKAKEFNSSFEDFPM